MSNPFKVGDKVVRLQEWWFSYMWKHGGDVVKVVQTGTHRGGEPSIYVDALPTIALDADRFRAAIAGIDYPLPPADAEQVPANSGHLPDGSSVQKHSAGPIYPCVITLRDKRLKGTGLFDYGITSPRNPEPVWLSTLEAAHAVADIINKDIAQ